MTEHGGVSETTKPRPQAGVVDEATAFPTAASSESATTSTPATTAHTATSSSASSTPAASFAAASKPFVPSSAKFVFTAADDDDDDDHFDDDDEDRPRPHHPSHHPSSSASPSSAQPTSSRQGANRPVSPSHFPSSPPQVYTTHAAKEQAEREALQDIVWASTKEELVRDPERSQRFQDEMSRIDRNPRDAAASARASAPQSQAPRDGAEDLVRAPQRSIVQHAQENTSVTSTLHIFNIPNERVRTKDVLSELKVEESSLTHDKWLNSSELLLVFKTAKDVQDILSAQLTTELFEMKMWDASAPPTRPAAPPRRSTERRSRVNVEAFKRVLVHTNSRNSVTARTEERRKERLKLRNPSQESLSSLHTSSPMTPSDIASPSQGDTAVQM
eukprot:Rhum_TRINITY_DN2016_c0_g1::Rhum_TRINITY_DN2016_c0_g1_i1::g.5436::m.5436